METKTKNFLKFLFLELYRASTENEIEEIMLKYPQVFHNNNWFPYGDNDNNYAVIKNQQASPIPALIEKITNSIDAILMRKCHEAKIIPNSPFAPKTMFEAISLFYPEHKNWDLPSYKKKQAENIQIIADGPKLNSSLIIYDNGEGQHPEAFENTFLSLLRGNKDDIHFVQGKYNMGGTGSIVFCGKKRFSLIGSKRYDKTGEFGFTIIREHPLSNEEKVTKKNTWYEFLKINDKISSFEIDEFDLGLYNRKFITGTIIKLYSYDLPPGSRSVISRDLNQSINEYLFEPALPLFTIDKKERYPDDKNLERELYGLKRRLEEDKNKYIEDYFSEEYNDKQIGNFKVTCYVFKTKTENKTVKETKDTIKREFFKNNMSVLFSLNGQVQGHYTSEFISRSLKYQLLKDYLLIHVDCTNLEYNFRKELFMASRDRLKGGEESRQLRDLLAKYLQKGQLNDIYKRRKDTISFDSGDTKELLKNFSKNLPLNKELMKLLDQTFKLEEKQEKIKPQSKSDRQKEKFEEAPFNPKRFPTEFKIKGKNDGIHPVTQIPLGGERTIKFITDVENQYFDRVEEPGKLKIELLDIKPNDVSGGDKEGLPDSVEDIFNVIIRSPNQGIIKVVLNPTDKINVGDNIQIKVTLTNPGNDFEQIFWVKIIDEEKTKKLDKKPKESEDTKIGLPEYELVYKEKKENFAFWDKLEEQGIEMGWKTIIYPLAEGNKLEKIYINMDSNVLKTYKSKLNTLEQYEVADKRYITTVYFHTLFLFTICKNRNYSFYRKTVANAEDEVDLADYLKDLFESYYSQFLLNFGMNDLIQTLES